MKGIDQVVTKNHSGNIAWPTIIFAFCCFIAFAVCLAMAHFEIIPLWLAFLANLLFAYLAFTPFHEAAHGNIAGNEASFRSLETLLGYMMGMMLLGPYPSFKFIHLTHHAHTNEGSSDPDFWVHEKKLWQVILKCLSILPYYYFFFFTHKKRSARKLLPITIVFLSAFIIFLVFLANVTSLNVVMMCWIFPGLLANALLAFVLDYLPHHPHDEIERYKNTNVVYGKIIYLLSMAHSFHVVHHLWPRIPFYSYKKVFFENKDLIAQKGTPIYDNLYALIKR